MKLFFENYYLLDLIILLIYLLICSYSDIKTQTISLKLSIIFIILFLILNFIFNFTSYLSLFFSIFPGCLILLLGKFTKQSIGYGDGIILIVSGMYTNFWYCTSILLTTLMLSSFFSLFLILKKRSLKTVFPLAPFILLSYLINLFFTYQGVYT